MLQLTFKGLLGCRINSYLIIQVNFLGVFLGIVILISSITANFLGVFLVTGIVPLLPADRFLGVFLFNDDII